MLLVYKKDHELTLLILLPIEVSIFYTQTNAWHATISLLQSILHLLFKKMFYFQCSGYKTVSICTEHKVRELLGQ